MLEARDDFSLSILIMPVCRLPVAVATQTGVGIGRRTFVIIKIMPPICLCVVCRPL
ncbi:MAG: hypothetical protein U9Q94_04235 [Candidatus Bipolaricaulota bacterium]|nr:hypothetical protein [Candidatus Bipolaricaulota bacterium]